MLIKTSISKKIIAIRQFVYMGKYQEAARVADEVHWGRVKDVKILNMVADVYEKCERYHEAKSVLIVVYNRVEANKRLLFRLCELSAKSGDLADASDFYSKFKRIAPNDPGNFILVYHILNASNKPDDKKIEALELYVKADFDDKWSYKLAQLYYKTHQIEKCVKICDEIVLWYSGETYGDAALKLKHKCLGTEAEHEETAEIQHADDSEIEDASKEADVNEEAEEKMSDDECVEIKPDEQEVSSESDFEEAVSAKQDDGPKLWFNLKEFNSEDIIKAEDNKDLPVKECVEEAEAETPAEEVLAEEADAEEVLVEEAVVEEVLAEEAAVEEVPVEETGKEEADNEDADTEDAGTVDTYDTAIMEEVCINDMEEECSGIEDTEEVCSGDGYAEEVCGGVEDAERKLCNIVLEKSTEKEKIFVFNYNLPQYSPIIEEEPGIKEIFIEADIADSDEEEYETYDMFSEEIYIEEGVSEDIPEEAPEEKSEDILEEFIEEDTPEEASEDISEEVPEEVSEENTAEDTTEEAEECTPEDIYEEELTEEFAEEDIEEFVVEDGAEVSDEAYKGDVFAEVAATSEETAEETTTVEEETPESKVTFVGYINDENSFMPADNEESDEEAQEINESKENQMSEDSDKDVKIDGNNVRVVLLECSQMKGGVKTAANKLQIMHQQDGSRFYGAARISGSKISERGFGDVLPLLKGRALIIEGVDGITYEAVNELMVTMNNYTKRVWIAIVDTPVKLALFVNKHRSLSARCEYIYEEPSITRSEFINYINSYAYKLNAILDDLADEEIEYIADEMTEDGIAFTISEAALLVDRALEKAQKPGIKGLFEAKKDSEGYLILRARHFDRG